MTAGHQETGLQLIYLSHLFCFIPYHLDKKTKERDQYSWKNLWNAGQLRCGKSQSVPLPKTVHAQREPKSKERIVVDNKQCNNDGSAYRSDDSESAEPPVTPAGAKGKKRPGPQPVTSMIDTTMLTRTT